MRRSIKNRSDMMKKRNVRKERKKRKGKNRNTVLNILVALHQASIPVDKKTCVHIGYKFL
jgi:hypothetical protein